VKKVNQTGNWAGAARRLRPVPALCAAFGHGSDVEFLGLAADALEKIQAKGKAVAHAFTKLLQHDSALPSRVLC
jgi:hypothetical protein